MRSTNQPRRIHDMYFDWLYDMLYDVRDPESPFSMTAICNIMHMIRFTPLVPHDENRVADVTELRNRFRAEVGGLSPMEDVDILVPDASVFEVLIALGGRADFMVPLTPRVWFHIFTENLKIDRYSDQYALGNSTHLVERAVHSFNNRTYSKTGKGGIFPLRRPRADQRQVELWYQMGAYMTENAMY